MSEPNSYHHAAPHVIETEIELFLDNFKYVTSLLNSEFSVLDCQLTSNVQHQHQHQHQVVFGNHNNRLSWPDYDSSTLSVSGPKHSVTSDTNRNSVTSSSLVSTDITSFEFEPDPPPVGTGNSPDRQLDRLAADCCLDEPTDDTMAESPGSCTLTIIDVVDALQASYAFISGGKSRCFCHIITFPECPAASVISEEQYRSVVTYLTNIPPLHDADVGFVLIVDRRQDKWGSVKTLLLRISGYFPALVQKVYILRPSSFLQKAFTDVSFKFLADDFKAKILMLNSVDELHGFIDRDQLTFDLGGTLEYNHREWIQHRAALEKFSGSASEIASRLRLLCARLQDTQFPNDVAQTEALIAEHNIARHEVRRDLEAVMRHGEVLLVCFKTVRSNPIGSRDSLDQDDVDSLDGECTDVVVSTELLPVCRVTHVTAVERLLVQLDETACNFETFWTSHKHRLEQCLQLRNFEEQFRQLHFVISQHLTTLQNFDQDVSDCTERSNNLLAELSNFEHNTRADIDRAEQLRLCGEKFIDDSHYAVDCIRPKCTELERICRDYNSFIDSRRRQLEMSHQLCSFVDEINIWKKRAFHLLQPQQQLQSEAGQQSSGPESESRVQALTTDLTCAEAEVILNDIDSLLYESETFFTNDFMEFEQQPNRSSALSDDQQMALKNTICCLRDAQSQCSRYREVVRHFLENSVDHGLRFHRSRPSRCQQVVPSSYDTSVTPKDKQTHVIKELLDTEHIYVEELRNILQGYVHQVDNPGLQHLVPDTLKSYKNILFGNWEQIYEFHSRAFLKELEQACTSPATIGQCFLARDAEFQLYSTYCQNMMASEQLLQELGDDNEFLQECQRRLQHRLPLRAYLLKPVQRITKYQLLLKELLRYCECETGCEELEKALTTMLSVVKHVNDLMHQISIRGYPGDFSSLGRLLMQGSFSVWVEHRWDRIRDLRFKPMCRHLFLYEQAVLFCKKKEDATNAGSAIYLFKNSLKTADIGLTESVKSDKKKFEVWLRGRTEVYCLQAATVEMKDVWLQEFKKVLQNQFEEIRECRRLKNPARSFGQLSFDKSPSSSVGQLPASSGSEADLASNGSLHGSEAELSTASTATMTAAVATVAHIATGLPAWEMCRSPTVDAYISGLDTEISEKGLSSSPFYITTSSHLASCAGELTVSESQLVQLLAVGRDGRWFVRSTVTQEEGWVPAQCLESAKRHSTHSLQFLSSAAGKSPEEDSSSTA